MFCPHPDGFISRDLRELLAPALGLNPDAMTPGQMTYHLRRLRLHGLIERTPHTFRYKTTDFGLRSALVLTRVYNRFLTTVMADAGAHQSHPSPLGRALDNVAVEIDLLAQSLRIAA